MKKDLVRHCAGCAFSSGPVRTDPSETTCCTCCKDDKGTRGPGRNDGGGW